MPRYKVLARSKGSVEVLKTFGKKEEAESFVRMTQRNPKYGSLMIEEEKAPTPAAATPAPEPTAAVAKPKSTGMPYWAMGLLLLVILGGAIAAIEGINAMLSRM
ncbi:MAG: hypothetical protein EAZ99_17980 [Alphaproteobacteria bacterium]|nr:MAG: hypothetical protein EAZ99_17980 [Alphaproteobacteria bacterium]